MNNIIQFYHPKSKFFIVTVSSLYTNFFLIQLFCVDLSGTKYGKDSQQIHPRAVADEIRIRLHVSSVKSVL